MKNWRKHVILLAFIFMMVFMFSGGASADNSSVNSTNNTTSVLPNYHDIYIKMSNHENISFDVTHNSTYYLQKINITNGGFNAIHIANDSTATTNYGGYTFTSDQSGVFYVTDTGGRGYQDDVILMFAVNGTVPDNFVLHLIVSGYNWTPSGVQNAAPNLTSINDYTITLDEIFNKSDFIYGPQNWKPTGANENYPIFLNENMSDPSNIFSIMFIDLHAGLLGSNYPGGDAQFINNGAVKVEYSFENLYSLAAFNAYAWNWNTSQGQGMLWTNSILPGNTGGPSGYSVIGSSNLSAGFTSNVTSPMTVQFNDKSHGNPTSWIWDFGDGTTSTEQNPTHTYNKAGTYEVKLTVSNSGGSDETISYITVNTIDVSANLPDGLYNTTQTVNLTASDSLYPDPKIYYTLDGSDPTTNSTLYNGSIIISDEGTTVLKFIAVDDGGNISNIITRTYTIDKTGPTVTADPKGSTYNERETVTLKTNDENSTTYYTTDGSDPRTSKTRIKCTGSTPVYTTTTLKFAAVDAAGNWSPVYSETYTMVDIKAPLVSADLPGGSYATNQAVDLSAVDEMGPDPKIYYTLDGTSPTTNSTLYIRPISIDTTGTKVLKFMAVDDAGHISDIITRIYTLDKPASSGTWNSTKVDSNSMYNSIAVDVSGNPHIAYYVYSLSPDTYPQLRYAYKDKYGWHIETVESAKSGVGYFVSLVLDSSGNPHMVYLEGRGDDNPNILKYAYKDSTGWHFSILATNYDGNALGDYISYINLVLYHDQPRISFYNQTSRQIEYMFNNGTNWIKENVTQSGGWNSLALDSSGNPNISYYSVSPASGKGSLRYAKRIAADTWTITIVDDSTDDVGEWNSLALDSSGSPRISYIAGANGGVLKYAYWDGTQWNTEAVDNQKASSSKLVIDKSGSPLIVYQDLITNHLIYAYKEGSNWVTTNTIDTLDGAEQWISFVLNSAGVPTVSYATATSKLKYAYLIPFNVSVNPIGGNYDTSKLVTLTSTNGTTIYYTTDGTNPRTSDTRVKYTSPILINHTTKLEFAAEDSANNWGSVYIEIYVINDTAPPTASASLQSGIYNANKSITLSMNEIGTIYYTTNGSTPTTASMKYTAPISITSSTNLKFLAVDAAVNKSPVYSVTYTIDKTAPTASASIPGGAYNVNKSVTLKMSESGTIYYTRNGTTPTTASTKYTSPISVTSTTTLKFLAVDGAGNKSPVYTAVYTIDKTAPKVSSTSPKNGVTGVSRTCTIAIRLSENIKASINWSKIIVKNKYGKTVSITKWISGNMLYIKTNNKRTSYSYYTVYIPASALKDSAGNNAAGYTFRFKTGRY